jgi:fructose-1,6-bisphosphatase/inositol monophosphatase family enzyme
MERTQATAAEFVVRAVVAAVRHAHALGEKATDVIATRQAGYREWDPEVIRIDRELENIYLSALQQTGWRVTLLSEEVQQVELPGEGEPLFAVCDPFDGSALYRRGIRAFWFTAFALYGADGNPLAAAVGDLLNNRVEFCDADGVFAASVGNLATRQPLRPNRVTQLNDAYLATYLMKPHFLYPTVERFKALLSAVKFVVPNGGPCGFTDVAAGRVDIYLAVRQPMTEVFTGLPIALRAGCVVTDFEGNPVPFDPDIRRRYDLVCACTPELHQQVLALLK